MGRYRRIQTRIWGDKKFSSMSLEGQLAFIFAFSHPETLSLGVLRGTLAGRAAERIGSEKAFEKGFGEALAKGLLKTSSKAPLIVIPSFLLHNPPESANVLKSWPKLIDDLPECPLLDEYLQHVKGLLEGLHEGLTKDLPEAFWKAFSHRIQDTGDQDTGSDPPQPPVGELFSPGPDNGQQPAPKKSRSRKKKPDKEQYRVLFDRFWAAYPNKIAKDHARAAFANREPDEELTSKMVTAIEAQERLRARMANTGGFVPPWKHPSTWLNGACWEDEPAETLVPERDFGGTPAGDLVGPDDDH